MNLSGLSPSSTGKYIYVNKKVTWFNAVSYCKRHYTNLASVRNLKENQEIQKVVPNDRRAWIGLSRSTWIWWSDRSKFSYTNWAHGHPLTGAGKCAASVFNQTYQGEWMENLCHEKLPFVCNSSESFSSPTNLASMTCLCVCTSLSSDLFFSQEANVQYQTERAEIHGGPERPGCDGRHPEPGDSSGSCWARRS